jgi:hypothetical protein
MKEQSQPQFDFLETYIQKLLDEQGFSELSEETRNQYIPQFVAEAQERLGIVLLEKLSEENAVKLASMLKDGDIDQDSLKNFWVASVPDFESIVKKVLEDFAQELKGLVSQIRQ